MGSETLKALNHAYAHATPKPHPRPVETPTQKHTENVNLTLKEFNRVEINWKTTCTTGNLGRLALLVVSQGPYKVALRAASVSRPNNQNKAAWGTKYISAVGILMSNVGGRLYTRSCSPNARHKLQTNPSNRTDCKSELTPRTASEIIDSSRMKRLKIQAQ